MNGIYKSGIVRCWKCRTNTRVWTWPGHKLWPKGLPTDEAEKPISLKWMYSKTIGSSYWASSCEHCEAIQGDWYLFVGHDRVFEGNKELGIIDTLFPAI